MAEYTYNPVQTVAPNGNVLLNNAIRCNRGSYGYDQMMNNNSYRRGYEPMPNRYMSRDPYYDGGYSGHANKEDLKMDLRMMMENAKTDKERMAIQQLLEQWKD